MDSVASQDLEGSMWLFWTFPESRRGLPVRGGGGTQWVSFGEHQKSYQDKKSFLSRTLPLSGANGEPSLEKWACEKPESREKPCVWGLRRKANDKVPTQDSELSQPLEPYLSIFVNPLH